MLQHSFGVNSQDFSFYLVIPRQYHFIEINACEKFDDLLRECHLHAIDVEDIAIVYAVTDPEFP